MAVDPDWLTKDAAAGVPDEKTGWPTIVVRPGTWRLKADGRLLYESRRDEVPALASASSDAAAPPLTTSGPIGVRKLGSQNKIVLQNGTDGYRDQIGEQMTTGQWGRDTGYESHGGANAIFLYSNDDASRHGRSLIRFDLKGQVPTGAKVIRAILVLYCRKGINGSGVLAGYKALQPWRDGKTFWINWGQGDDKPGYIDEAEILSGHTDEKIGKYYFRVTTSVVQDWLDRPQKIHGLLLKSIRDSNAFHWIANGDVDNHPPKLVIEYNTP